MPVFNAELVHAMRSALEEVMTRVPSEYATPEAKVHLAECILKTAAQGHTSYDEMVTAAVDQTPAILSMCTRRASAAPPVGCYSLQRAGRTPKGWLHHATKAFDDAAPRVG